MITHNLPSLNSGDSVSIIAPASRCSSKTIIDLKELLSSWKLHSVIDDEIFGDDILCANSDEARFLSLQKALQNPATKAIICARGGYGSIRLIPALAKIKRPDSPKLFIGMSDITALLLYLQQEWLWPVIHASAAVEKFSRPSIQALKSILFAENKSITWQGIPLNAQATDNHTIEASITGGNLSIIQASIGTVWQIKAENKIIFLEEIGERAYRVDRILEHLWQTNIFAKAQAILFGDFLEGKEPNGSSLILPVLERFAKRCKIPVALVKGIGHGPDNFPILLGAKAKLILADPIFLSQSIHNQTTL